MTPCTGCGSTDPAHHVFGKKACCPDCKHPAPRLDSKGREHADDCTFDEPGVRFPVCMCGTWPSLHLN